MSDGREVLLFLTLEDQITVIPTYYTLRCLNLEDFQKMHQMFFHSINDLQRICYLLISQPFCSMGVQSTQPSTTSICFCKGHFASQANMLPYFFCINKHNYLRWLPVYLLEIMVDLRVELEIQFEAGEYTLRICPNAPLKGN